MSIVLVLAAMAIIILLGLIKADEAAITKAARKNGFQDLKVELARLEETLKLDKLRLEEEVTKYQNLKDDYLKNSYERGIEICKTIVEHDEKNIQRFYEMHKELIEEQGGIEKLHEPVEEREYPDTIFF